MSVIRSFEEIASWQKARELNLILGKLIDDGRFKTHYRLISQIESAAGSIMDNIAEGFERSGNKEFLQFLYIAKGSCGEFRSQLYRAADRGFITEAEFEDLYERAKHIIILIQKLITYLHETEMKGAKYK